MSLPIFSAAHVEFGVEDQKSVPLIRPRPIRRILKCRFDIKPETAVSESFSSSDFIQKKQRSTYDKNQISGASDITISSKNSMKETEYQYTDSIERSEINSCIEENSTNQIVVDNRFVISDHVSSCSPRKSIESCRNNIITKPTNNNLNRDGKQHIFNSDPTNRIRNLKRHERPPHQTTITSCQNLSSIFSAPFPNFSASLPSSSSSSSAAPIQPTTIHSSATVIFVPGYHSSSLCQPPLSPHSPPTKKRSCIIATPPRGILLSLSPPSSANSNPSPLTQATKSVARIHLS